MSLAYYLSILLCAIICFFIVDPGDHYARAFNLFYELMKSIFLTFSSVVLIVSILIIRQQVKKYGVIELSVRHKLVYIHLFVFVGQIICSTISEVLSNLMYSVEPPKNCRMYVTYSVFLEMATSLNFVMVILLIYMTEKITKTPLQSIWSGLLAKMQSKHSSCNSLLHLSGSDQTLDTEESIKRYNRVSSVHAELIMINILNNLTES